MAKSEYSYVELGKSKFLIMRRAAGSTTMWTQYATAPHAIAARHLVSILNKDNEKKAKLPRKDEV